MTAPGIASEHVGAEQLAAAEAGQAAAEAAAAAERQQRQVLEATNAELHQAVATAEDTAAAGRAAAASAAAAAAAAAVTAASTAAGLQAQVVDLQRQLAEAKRAPAAAAGGGAAAAPAGAVLWVDGAGTAEFNGFYKPNGEYCGKPQYAKVDGSGMEVGWYSRAFGNDEWRIGKTGLGLWSSVVYRVNSSASQPPATGCGAGPKRDHARHQRDELTPVSPTHILSLWWRTSLW